ncbi:MAG: DNA polymerase IV [Actinomycetota bacterium]
MDESILHVDMDAFYASVEVRDDSSLRGLPVVVGYPGPRGVVAAASYEARAFGVHSAMPSVQARRLCPQIVFVPPDFTRYKIESDAIFEIFGSFTPLVEGISLDEAFLDVSGSHRLFGSPEQIAHAIRARVREQRSLACSVGVAPNKFLAKLASGKAKPDGVCIVRSHEIQAFLDPLPVEDLWGVGEVTATALRRLGARTVVELLGLPKGALEKALGANAAAHLRNLARGIDDREVIVHEPAKSVSAEQTYDRDLDNDDDIHVELLRLSERVASRMRAERVSGRTITVKIRFATFKTITRARTIDEPTNVAEVLYQTSRELYDAQHIDKPRIRLLGVGVSGLTDGEGSEQLSIGDDSNRERWRAADGAMDRMRSRFGADAVGRAALADRRTVRPRHAPTKMPRPKNG